MSVKKQGGFMKTWKMSNAAKAERRKLGVHELPPGPWRNEPDKAQWKDEATGLDCLIVRAPMGALCGYVGVTPAHPLHSKGYDDAEALGVEAHGGLTFSAPCQERVDESVGVCHVTEEGAPEVWWFGFDCAHAFDLIPAHSEFPMGDYRDFDYVKAEVTKLAAQLAEVTP